MIAKAVATIMLCAFIWQRFYDPPLVVESKNPMLLVYELSAIWLALNAIMP